MKQSKLVFFLVFLTFFFAVINPVSSQSTLTLQQGTSINITLGADLCANNIIGINNIYGNGTLCYGNVGVQNISSTITPEKFELFQNYPNPFNPSTFIKFQLPEKSYVQIKIYDLLGRETANIFEGEFEQGFYSASFDGSGLPSGIYYYKIEAHGLSNKESGFIKTMKMSLIK